MNFLCNLATSYLADWTKWRSLTAIATASPSLFYAVLYTGIGYRDPCYQKYGQMV
ncbi:uncharacterized protein CC84DRAFT_1159621, partial [Paraphaeosphaeria sporulosa]